MTRRRILVSLTAAVSLVVVLHATAAQAATVTKTADTNDGVCNADCSLREAVFVTNNPASGDDLIDLPPGTYALTLGQLAITDPLTIDGDDDSLPHVVASAGARVFAITSTFAFEEVTFQDIVIRGGNVNGNGGGILNDGLGPMTIRRSLVRDNAAASSGGLAGGGGIYHEPSALLTIEQSTVSGNTATVSGGTSGGGGIYSMSGADIQNSTIDGNRLNSGGFSPNSGGGGYYTNDGGGTLTHVTVTSNTAAFAGGGIYNDGGPVTVRNSIFAGNVSERANCGATPPSTIISQGINLEDADTCNLTDPRDVLFTDPKLGPLADNGGPTPTRRLTAGSAAINGADFNWCLGVDQRGKGQVGDECDIGAYEFEGDISAAIPDCSRSGEIPVTMDPVAGSGILALHYMVDSGSEQVIDVPDGPSTQIRTIGFPEGRRTLTFWGEWVEGEQLGRPTGEVLVDQTNPTVGIENNQRFAIFVIKRRVTIDVNAGDALSGLTNDPSGAGQPLSTSTRGTQSVVATATDLCENQAAATFDYTVLAPKLGERTVIEPLNDNVKVRASGSGAGGARAAQKGRPLVPLTEPRELPVGSFIDTRRGARARITTSSNAGDGIQDGVFFGGVFQALQSRSVRPRVRGLTTLRLKGGSFRRCAAHGKGKRATAAQRRRLSRRTIRKLGGNASGRYRTGGRHSAATVRGTIWTVADRCDGTLTTVKRGRVAVRDFRRKRTVVLRAGKRYLARAPF